MNQHHPLQTYPQPHHLLCGDASRRPEPLCLGRPLRFAQRELSVEMAFSRVFCLIYSTRTSSARDSERQFACQSDSRSLRLCGVLGADCDIEGLPQRARGAVPGRMHAPWLHHAHHRAHGRQRAGPHPQRQAALAGKVRPSPISSPCDNP